MGSRDEKFVLDIRQLMIGAGANPAHNASRMLSVGHSLQPIETPDITHEQLLAQALFEYCLHYQTIARPRSHLAAQA